MGTGIRDQGSKARVLDPRSLPPDPPDPPERSGRLARLPRPTLHLDLTTKDGAPVLMLRHRHPALDADADPLLRWLGPTQVVVSAMTPQPPCKSQRVDTLDGTARFMVGCPAGGPAAG